MIDAPIGAGAQKKGLSMDQGFLQALMGGAGKAGGQDELTQALKHARKVVALLEHALAEDEDALTLAEDDEDAE